MSGRDCVLFSESLHSAGWIIGLTLEPEDKKNVRAIFHSESSLRKLEWVSVTMPLAEGA